MDSFTEKMLERAKARHKKLENHYSNTNETPKTPLQEPNIILKKNENSNLTKSQPNLTECNTKMNRKEVVSDSNLSGKVSFNESDSNILKKGHTRVSSDVQGSPQTPVKTLNIQKENFNMEIKLTSAENVRVEVEIEERDNSDDDNADDITISEIRRIQSAEGTDKPIIREYAKNRLQRLGKLYADDEDLSSPIHRSESKFYDEDEENLEKQTKKSAQGGLGRLKALANTINEWEDEIATSSNKVNEEKEVPKKSWKTRAPKPPASTSVPFTHSPKKGPAPKPPASNTAISTKVSAKVSSRETSPEKSQISPEKNIKDGKSVAWDPAVLTSLESQGFTRTNSNTRLVYKYKKPGSFSDSESECDETTKLNLIEEEEDKENENDKLPSKTNKISKIASVFIGQKNTEDTKTVPQLKSPTKTGHVINKAAKFEQTSNQSPNKTKDPALLSVSERKALFEKNKGIALIPKAAFGMAAPVKQLEKGTTTNKSTIPVKPSSPQKVKNTIPIPEKASSPNKSNPYVAESGGIASKMKALLEKKTTISQSQIANNIQEQKQKDLDILLNRFHKNKEIEENDNESSSSEDEENITETTKIIPNRSAKIVQFKEKELLPPPPPPPLQIPQSKFGAPKRRSKGDSPKVREVLEDVKRIRVSPPKTGRMYPCLSDIEASSANETEQEDNNTNVTPSPDTSCEDNSVYTDSDEPNTSFGREILEVVCKNQTPQKRPMLNDSIPSDLSDILDGMDDYLDEAMGHDDDSDCTEGPTPPKLGKSSPLRNTAAPSHSFHYTNGSPSKYNNKSPIKPSAPPAEAALVETVTTSNYSSRKSTDLPTHVFDGENVMPLMHTVSFYRKQQAQGNRTPIRQITRQPSVAEESPEKENNDESLEVTEKIHELMNYVSKQQTVISQASQALNLCCSTIEFSGSSEQVEAERLLLVATQRRQAALHEVQRLRVEGSLHPGGGASVDKGTLIISDINLPLKKEYARALSATGGQGHHVVCLVRYAEHVLPTKLVSTVASPKDNLEMNLKIPGTVKLENIYADFTVTAEVYCLQAQEELLPHDVKYHISTKKNKLTPKKKQDTKLIMPTIQSPAGPQAVRSPSFALMGYVVFSLQGIQRTHWTLNNTPAMSPLEGSIKMKIKCELAVSVEHRGFLTMFDDISGFGAWHRRWCLLKGHSLSYWKYPDDERKKPPMDSINLQICVTKTVGLVSRDICARPNTFLLETVRSAKPSDKDSLITVRKGSETMIRHLLSADTKEERNEWCEKMNKTLHAIKLWGKNNNK